MSRTGLGMLLAAMTLMSLPSGAAATAVETSLRPRTRPGVMVTTAQARRPEATMAHASARIARAALTGRSLRPRLRPVGLRAQDVPEIAHPSAANPAFDRWITRFRARARAEGIRPGVFDAAFRGVSYNRDVIDKDRNQSEFRNEIWDYLDNAAAPPRIEEGRRALRRHRAALRRIEARYGVEAEVVTAIWGLESRYGTRMGDYPVIEALATLAFDGRRGRFFEQQLVAALKILQSGDVRPDLFTGSWAGAMGHTQFIPSSYLAYAVDFNGDGKRDIWSADPVDALASTAAYLRRSGWISGQPWGVEVRLPQGLGATDERRLPSQWAALGVVGIDGRPVPDYGSARLWLPAGPRGPAFLVFRNFSVIKRYNNSDAYALGVGHLADRIRGGPPIRARWPRGYEALSFGEKEELQRLLKRRGYDLEKIDGLIGPNTKEAIVAFQRSVGLPADGNPSRAVLQQLKRR